MDFTKENDNPNPRDKSTPFGILFFTYTYGMFKRGYYSKTLEAQDLYNPTKSDRSMLLGDRLERAWSKQYEKGKAKKRKPSLLLALTRAFWPEQTILAVTLSLMQICTVIQPLMLGKLLAFFRENTNLTKNDAFVYAGAISICSFCNALLLNQYLMGAFHYGMRVRAASCALIYRKALRLSKTALGETASGKIVNLLSNDVSRFDLATHFIHYMWVSPLTAMIITSLLYADAGWAGVLGIGTIFVVVPIQGYTGKLSAVYRKATALKTDERVRLMNEILSGIQVIKMYAWETPFAKLIHLARKAELKVITKSSYLRGLFMTFNMFTSRVALFATLLTVALTDQPVTASKVFVMMTYLNIISHTMSQMFVRGISEVAELLVSIKRLEEFMLNDEYQSLIIPQTNEYITNKYILSLDNLTVKWNSRLPDNALENITLGVNRGELLGIIGPVGSGKSSLLQTILGELELVSGDIKVNGRVSYASQEAWVFAATVRQNILFGVEYDKKKYQDVVKACALEKDFEQFSNNDLTIVGDRGASLSGGQKARINLARAIYRDADIYLLDDPLSAVDIHVSKHLYDLCINGYLYNKTRILVTHQVHHLKDADNIVILNNGRIENQGTFKTLAESDNLYAKLLTAEPDATEEEKQKIESSKKNRKTSYKSNRSLSVSEMSIPDIILAEQDEDSEEEEEREIKLKDMQEESSKGKVKGSLLLKYLFSGGNFLFVFIVFLLYLMAQGAAISTDYFVSFWTKVEDYKAVRQQVISSADRNFTLNITEDLSVVTPPPIAIYAVNWDRDTFLYIYGTLVISLFIFALLRSMLFYKLAMVCSQKMHDSIFYSVVNASMRFFDTNPGGRILNRFSKDVGSVDELLPKAILDASQLILMTVGSIILVIVVNPMFLALVVVIGAVSMFFRHIYLRTSKNVKRLEGAMRSPVFTHLNATLNGLTTIRAFRAENILRDEFDKHQDGHTSAWFMFIAASSAFGFYVDIMCFIFLSVVTFSFLILGDELGMTAGDVGLAITQAISLSTLMVQWGLRQSAEVANQLMSVERVLEYKQLPCEKQPEKPKQPPRSWPEQGHIRFEDMGLRYDEKGALVLKNLNLSIKPNEKIGIVGRTGAGKSSLISALFRLAHVEGSIKIDGIDTKDLTLEQLRSKISIIPQDPVLFSGTLRYNLDPFEEYNDNILYKAIKDVELNDPANIINRLENRVMDGGSNYSVGQRQLICLARAIIRNNQILMLDEATANVDPQTDALIQKTIRKKFANCTVLTVAHRLNTIMDSDKVLVMEAGTMVEFDHPHRLLQKPDGVFYNMVSESGRAISDQLRKIAKDSFSRQLSLPE